MSRKRFRFWLTVIILIGLGFEGGLYYKHHMIVKHRAAEAQQAARQRVIDLAAGAITSKKVTHQDLPIVLSADGTIASNSSTDTVDMNFSLPEANIKDIQDGQEVTFVADDLPDLLFKGETYATDNKVDPDTKEFNVKAMVTNTDNKLQPDMTALVKIVTDIHQNVQVVPTTSIVKKGNDNFVFVIINGKAKLVPVTVVTQQEDLTEISKGLIDGQDVIATGTDHIQDGKEVVLENTTSSETSK